MSNSVAPSANVKDKIKRGPRIEYSDVEDDVIDPTGQLTNKGGTGANGQKRNDGKTTPSTAAISTPKVSKDDPPTTSTTPKEVDLKDPKPQGQDSSGSSTAMRYVAVMLVVMGLFVPSVLCCFQNGWPSTSQSAEANLGESRHEDVHIEIANIKHRIEKEVSLRIETQNKFQQKVEDVDRSLEHMLEAVQKLTSTPKEIEGSIKQTTATVKQISRLASSLSNLEKSVRETNETTLALGRKAEGRDMRIEMLAAELGDVHQEIERKMMDVYSKLQETLKDKVDKMDNSQDIAKGQLNIVFKNIEKTDTLVAVVLAIVIIQVAQFFLFWKRIAPN